MDWGNSGIAELIILMGFILIAKIHEKVKYGDQIKKDRKNNYSITWGGKTK